MNKIAALAVVAGLVTLGPSSCSSSGENTDTTADSSAGDASGKDALAQGGASQGGGGHSGASGQDGVGGGGTGQGGAGRGGTTGQGGAGLGGSGGANPIDADFTYDPPPIPFDELPERCRNAAEKGVQWLASVQQADGSWEAYHVIADTSIALTKLQTYALEHDQNPFDPSFRYHEHITKGFAYLFNQLQTIRMDGSDHDLNRNGLGVTDRASPGNGYVNALVLMAITAGRGFDQTVVSSNALNGKTYQEVAQDMVDYFGHCQTGAGGWKYKCGIDNDNSVTQYVSLALEYATHPDYAFFCQIHPSLPAKLASWVTRMQNADGGSDYDGTWGSSLYRTGALLQELAFLKVGLGETLPGQSEKRVDMALAYVDTNFDQFFGSSPADYMGMWSVMKGLVTQGIDTVGGRDWYQKYCDVLVAEQEEAGSWSSSYRNVLSTSWALLVLEKAAPRKLH